MTWPMFQRIISYIRSMLWNIQLIINFTQSVWELYINFYGEIAC